MLQEYNHEANVTGDVLQDALFLYLENIIDARVVDSGASFHATSDRKHFHDYVQGDLDMFDWVMMNPVKSLEWVQFS